jgi:cytochrome c5
MKLRFLVAAVLITGAMSLSLVANASGGKDAPKEAVASSSAPAAASAQDENLHLEGEKRFRSNCGRCHAAPPKFSPRMMATIVRHMRVRATLTEQDARLILRYMTE